MRRSYGRCGGSELSADDGRHGAGTDQQAAQEGANSLLRVGQPSFGWPPAEAGEWSLAFGRDPSFRCTLGPPASPGFPFARKIFNRGGDHSDRGRHIN